MSYHLDSDEQFQTIKEYIAKTWKLFLAVIVIGLLTIWGWRYWQSHQTQQMMSSSDQYEQLIAKINPAEPNSVVELIAFAKKDDSVYSIFASLQAAQFYVDSLKDYAGAEVLLTDAINKTKSEPILSLIELRIARLQYQLEQYDTSLNTLNKVTDSSWSAVVNDIRGDIYTKQQNYQNATNAYQVALNSDPTPELKQNIAMKLNQIQYLQTINAASPAAN